jgi:hypothetical protein
MFAEIPPIPVPHLLNNNVVPSPSETKLIQSALSVVRHDISRLDNEINRVQTLLPILLHNRHLLRRYYYCQQTIFAPVRRLPPEILSLIFLECLTFYHNGEVVYPSRKDILLFGQICRYWRDVATSTSRLWSTLSIDLRAWNIDRELELMSTWLARSGGAPLSLELNGYFETMEAHPITNAILAHASRLYSLAIQAPLSTIQFSERHGTTSSAIFITRMVHGARLPTDAA